MTMRSAHPLWLLLPAMALIAVFYVLPNILNFALAFTDWNTFRPDISFVGFESFVGQGGELSGALQRTFVFAIASTILMNLIALALAVALEPEGKFSSFFGIILFLPILISPLAAGYTFRALLDDTGPLNALLALPLGAKTAKIDWLGRRDTAMASVILAHCWRFYALHMLVYLAALRAVPREIVESARVDGAGAWRTFASVKLPMIGPAITFNVSIVFIASLSAFDTIMAMTKGGPARATEVLNIYVWRIFSTGAFGFSTAISLVLVLAILVTGLPLIAFLRRREIDA